MRLDAAIFARWSLLISAKPYAHSGATRYAVDASITFTTSFSISDTASRAASSGKHRITASTLLSSRLRSAASLRLAGSMETSSRSRRPSRRSRICRPVVPASPSMKTLETLLIRLLFQPSEVGACAYLSQVGVGIKTRHAGLRPPPLREDTLIIFAGKALPLLVVSKRALAGMDIINPAKPAARFNTLHHAEHDPALQKQYGRFVSRSARPVTHVREAISASRTGSSGGPSCGRTSYAQPRGYRGS